MKNFFRFLFVAFFLVYAYVWPHDIYAQSQNAQAAPALPRIVLFPSLTFHSAWSWDWKHYRYSLLVMVASWNTMSDTVLGTLEPYVKEFRRRNIGVLALASHDTDESLHAWKEKRKFSMPIERVTLQLISELKNPKIPTLWIVSDRGQILKMVELPVVQDVQYCVELLLLWTSF